MFAYRKSSMKDVLKVTRRRKDAVSEWPSLAGEDLSRIRGEDDLVGVISRSTGRSMAESVPVVRDWMERHGLPPVDKKALQIESDATAIWDNDGGHQPRHRDWLTVSR